MHCCEATGFRIFVVREVEVDVESWRGCGRLTGDRDSDIERNQEGESFTEIMV